MQKYIKKNDNSLGFLSRYFGILWSVSSAIAIPLCGAASRTSMLADHKQSLKPDLRMWSVPPLMVLANTALAVDCMNGF